MKDSIFLARNENEDMKQYALRVMTPELAAAIRRYRVSQGSSWRGVGARVHDEWPGFDVKPLSWDPQRRWVSQLDGKDICEAAMEYLKEKEEDGWN